jgi:ACS family hexuronate transporter-like MFS transporter
MPLSILAYYTQNFPVCVALVSLATASHQAWSANVFTSATDLFPSKVSGSVVGLGATAGGIGGMFLTLIAALVIQWTGKQQVIFIWAGLMHPLSLLVYWLWLRTKFDPVNVDRPLDLSKPHRPLLTAGSVIGLVGAVLAALIYFNWDVCVKAAGMSGAAQAVTAAVGVIIIGAALLYAGTARKAAAATS